MRDLRVGLARTLEGEEAVVEVMDDSASKGGSL